MEEKKQVVEMEEVVDVKDVEATVQKRMSRAKIAESWMGDKKIVENQNGELMILASEHYALVLPDKFDADIDSILNPLNYLNAGNYEEACPMVSETNLEVSGLEMCLWCILRSAPKGGRKYAKLCDPKYATHVFVICESARAKKLDARDTGRFPSELVFDSIYEDGGLPVGHCFVMPVGYVRLLWSDAEGNYWDIDGIEVDSYKTKIKEMSDYFLERGREWREGWQSILDDDRKKRYLNIKERERRTEMWAKYCGRLEEIQKKCEALQAKAEREFGEKDGAIRSLFDNVTDDVFGRFVRHFSDDGKFFVLGKTYDCTEENVKKAEDAVGELEKQIDDVRWCRKLDRLARRLENEPVKVYLRGEEKTAHKMILNVTVSIYDERISVAMKNKTTLRERYSGADFKLEDVYNEVVGVCKAMPVRYFIARTINRVFGK